MDPDWRYFLLKMGIFHCYVSLGFLFQTLSLMVTTRWHGNGKSASFFRGCCNGHLSNLNHSKSNFEQPRLRDRTLFVSWFHTCSHVRRVKIHFQIRPDVGKTFRWSPKVLTFFPWKMSLKWKGVPNQTSELPSMDYTVDGWNPANQLIGCFSHYL